MKLFIAAMYEELQNCIDFFDAKKVDDSICQIYIKNDLIFCISGIGFINASSNLTYLLCKYDINKIYNVGTVGACDNSLKQGDEVLVENILCCSGEFTAFEYRDGKRTEKSKVYTTSQLNYLNNLKKVNLVSAADFIESKFIIDQFSQIVDIPLHVVDMEAFALAKRADIFNIEFYCLKIVSDLIWKKTNSLQFDEFIKIAGYKILEMVKKFCN